MRLIILFVLLSLSLSAQKPDIVEITDANNTQNLIGLSDIRVIIPGASGNMIMLSSFSLQRVQTRTNFANFVSQYRCNFLELSLSNGNKIAVNSQYIDRVRPSGANTNILMHSPPQSYVVTQSLSQIANSLSSCGGGTNYVLSLAYNSVTDSLELIQNAGIIRASMSSFVKVGVDSLWGVGDTVFYRANDGRIDYALVAGDVTALNTGGGEEIFRAKVGNELWLKTLLGAGVSYVTTDSTITIVATGEINTGENTGGGEGIFRDKYSTILRYKTLLAGQGISYTSTDSTITINSKGENNIGENLGFGTMVYAGKTDTTLRFRTIMVGANMAMSQSATEINLWVPKIGETNIAQNIGGGSQVYATKVDSTLIFRTLVAGANTTLTQTDTTISIATTGGEVNTASNVGTGSGVFRDKSGSDLRFRRILQGTGITVTENADDITITNTASAAGQNNIGANLGTGSQVYASKADSTLRFRSVVAGTNVTLTQTDTSIIITSTGGGGDASWVAKDYASNTVSLRIDSATMFVVNATGLVTLDIDSIVAGKVFTVAVNGASSIVFTDKFRYTKEDGTKCQIDEVNVENAIFQFTVSDTVALLTYSSTFLDCIPDTIPANQMITVWKTDNTSSGSSTSTQVKLPLTSAGTYNFTVDWGDGDFDVITTWNQAETTHTYTSAGTYTIRITGQCHGWRFANTGDRLKILSVVRFGTDFRFGNANAYFQGCVNLNFHPNIDVPNLAGTITFASFFQNCSNFNGKIGGWNTSSVTTLFQTFTNAQIFNQPIGGWNTQSVTNMISTFNGASSFNQPLYWNTISATAMPNMFLSAVNFNQPLNFNTINVTSMNNMLNAAVSFNQPLNFTLNASVDMVNMLNLCGMNCTNYTQTLINWSGQSVTGSTLGATGRQYGTNGVSARNTLVTTLGWTITGDSAAAFTCP